MASDLAIPDSKMVAGDLTIAKNRRSDERLDIMHENEAAIAVR
jgi:hypothetical protein